MRNLSLPLWIAIRYLKSSRRDAFITFLSLTAAGGIALGIAALILALAALSGFQAALKSEVLSRTPHIEVELPPGVDYIWLEKIPFAKDVNSGLEKQTRNMHRMTLDISSKQVTDEKISDLYCEFSRADDRRCAAATARAGSPRSVGRRRVRRPEACACPPLRSKPCSDLPPGAPRNAAPCRARPRFRCAA